MTFEEQLAMLLATHKRNACSQILKTKPDLLNWIKSQVSYPYDSISELIWLYQNPSFVPVCELGNKFKFRAGRYLTGCGGNCFCVQKNKIKTNLKKYGVENPAQSSKIKEKSKNTFLKKYGVENPGQSKQIQEKIQKTNLTKYGVAFAFQSHGTQEKTKQTLLKKYGVTHQMKLDSTKKKIQQTNLTKYGVRFPLQNTDIKNKTKQTNFKKYGVAHPNQTHIPSEQMNILTNPTAFFDLINGKTVKEIKKELWVDAKTIARYAKNYGFLDSIKFDNSSSLEEKIESFCLSHQIEFVKNTRKIIPPLELDFYFPQSNSAIECHGLYWHSELAGERDRFYHFNKWKSCKEKDVDLYQYFEDEIEQSFNVIASKILYLNRCHTGNSIGARNLSVGWLNTYQHEDEFYNKNHIQGARLDRTFTVGTWHNSFELCACMSIRKKQGQLEIVRFATDIRNRYPGLFSKMLNWAVKQLQFQGNVISWSDNRHSNGNVYAKNGFELSREHLPGYFVTDYQTRWRREHFMKNKIKQRHPEVDLSKTEWQLEQELGYDRIWDAGKRLWILTV